MNDKEPIGETGREIRQLVLGRWRVLFDISGNIVRVVHLRGAFTGTEDKNPGVEE